MAVAEIPGRRIRMTDEGSRVPKGRDGAATAQGTTTPAPRTIRRLAQPSEGVRMSGQATKRRPERPSLASVETEFRERLERNGGKFGPLFREWIKFPGNAPKFLAARGDRGETFLQSKLSEQQVGTAIIVMRQLNERYVQDEPETFFTYVGEEDKRGNGIWHYLADSLRQNEGLETLRMARMLLAMDLDFCRQNKEGVSPLGKLLIPTPKWRSINALIQTKHVAMRHIERAVRETAKDDKELAEIMSRLFSSDVQDNEGLLSRHILRQSLAAQTDQAERAAIARLFFDYIDSADNSTAFLKLIPKADEETFDFLLALLASDCDDQVSKLAISDARTSRVYTQVILAARLLHRDQRKEGPLFKALFTGRIRFLRQLRSLLNNDDLTVMKLVRGERVKKPAIVDETSPAPCNPQMSLLLQQDRAGNTIFHHAALRNDLTALEALTHGLASNDVYAILTRVPNRAGLTLVDLASREAAAKKIDYLIRQNRIPRSAGEAIIRQLQQVGTDVAAAITKRVRDVEALANDTNGRTPLRPSFDLTKLAGTLLDRSRDPQGGAMRVGRPDGAGPPARSGIKGRSDARPQRLGQGVARQVAADRKRQDDGGRR